MPNHVSNSVIIRGPEPDLKAIRELVISEESGFDFNRIIPMPPELRDIHIGYCVIDGVRVDLWREVQSDDGTKKNVAVSGEDRASWRDRFGHDNWYDWSIANWGTKWNAYEASVGDDDGDYCLRFYFQTAWSDPLPILKVLSAKFPRCSIVNTLGGEVDEPESYKIKAGEILGRKTLAWD